MKKIILIFILFLTTQSKSQDFDGSFSGLYVGTNYSFIQSDLFQNSGGLGYQLGYSHGFFLYDRGDIIVDFETVKNTVKIQGIYKDESEFAGKKVEDTYSFFNININIYYNHYLIVNDNGNGFYVSVFAGPKLSGGNQWELVDENEDQSNIYYGNPYINYEAFEDLSTFNYGYGLGTTVGTYKYRIVLTYNHYTSNLFRDKKIYKEYDEYNNPVESAGIVTGSINLSALSLNLIFKL